ncbi:MAG TPA: hypothetical protein VNQ57_04315 [Ureibacillus sp.]|nr:hypothetical protein [Ureibacillus sp.]
MNSVLFPALLAGPMIRRLDSSQVLVWVATSKEFAIAAEIWEINTVDESDQYDKIASTTQTDTIQFGENLYMHLIQIAPKNGFFPTNQLIGYNLHFQHDQDSFDLGDLGLLTQSNPNNIVYDSLKYPTFFIAKKDSDHSANFLFGSCHKPHGEGEDMLASGENVLKEHYRNLKNRPEALFLMGDQIYADDVPDSLFRAINLLGKELMGVGEDLASIDKRLGSHYYNSAIHLINGRKEIMNSIASFSSRKASNHLIEFGEFAAMYLFSFSPILWEVAAENHLFESFDEAFEKEYFNLRLSKSTDKLKKYEKSKLEKRYTEQEARMTNCHQASYKIRRLFANIPTYMIFDDHDLTDDWNINADWKAAVQAAPFGKHVIANGLAAYFAFQGWGNESQSYQNSFTSKMRAYFQDLRNGQMMAQHKEWIAMLWEHQPWHFVAPTTPKVVFLDTRTMREYEDQPHGNIVEQILAKDAFPPQLVNELEYKEITNQLEACGWRKGEPLIIVSPSPVIGFDLIENAILQVLPTLEIIGSQVQTVFDIEAWRFNGKGLSNLLKQLEEWGPSDLVILSGDVHYSFSVDSTFTFSDEGVMRVKQITSSPLKNMSFRNFSLLMKVTASLHQALQQKATIYRYCNTSYEIQNVEKKDLPERDFLWKEQLNYEQIAGNSIIETENTLGFLSYSTKGTKNKFIK